MLGPMPTDVTEETWGGCARGADVVHDVIAHEPHSWPAWTRTRAYSTTWRTWTFFRGHAPRAHRRSSRQGLSRYTRPRLGCPAAWLTSVPWARIQRAWAEQPARRSPEPGVQFAPASA